MRPMVIVLFLSRELEEVQRIFRYLLWMKLDEVKPYDRIRLVKRL